MSFRIYVIILKISINFLNSGSFVISNVIKMFSHSFDLIDIYINFQCGFTNKKLNHFVFKYQFSSHIEKFFYFIFCIILNNQVLRKLKHNETQTKDLSDLLIVIQVIADNIAMEIIEYQQNIKKGIERNGKKLLK